MTDRRKLTDTGPPPRRQTQPQRKFDASSLAGLTRGQRRKLCQLLLTANGEHVREFNSPAAYDELVVQVTPLWRTRTVRVRIATRPVNQGDLDRLAERIDAAGDIEGILVASLGVDGSVTPDARIAIVEPDELIARLERSPLITWSDNNPAPAYDRVAVLRDLEEQAGLLDPIGIRWLPVLALNELPSELAMRSVAPQDLLERVAFRLMTAAFRFGGKRHGEAARGRRLADSVLTWPAASDDRIAALLDCKASADGYVMDADHVLRFQRYVEDAREPLAAEGHKLRYLIVISSTFPGRPGPGHPYYTRAEELRKNVEIELAYIRAADVALLAATVEAQELDPAGREHLDWRTALNHGLVGTEHLQHMLEATS
jgi:hypothetical protein